jgi:hypothetical protein
MKQNKTFFDDDDSFWLRFGRRLNGVVSAVLIALCTIVAGVFILLGICVAVALLPIVGIWFACFRLPFLWFKAEKETALAQRRRHKQNA